MEALTEILILLGLVLASGVLAGAEIAVVAMRPSRLRELAAGGSRAGRLLERLRGDPERFLSTVQVGITVVGVTAAAFGGTAFAADLEPLIRPLPVVGAFSEQVAMALVVIVVSYLSIVLGELVPKSLALRATERYACVIARPLTSLATLAKPLVWILTKSSNAVLMLFGDRTSFTESKLSLEELRGLVDEANRKGSVPSGAGTLMVRALDLAALTAADVMVHRRFVVSLPREAETAEVRKALLVHGHRRIPLYEGSPDNVIGYISWRDVFSRIWDGADRLDLPSILRPAYFVPEATPAMNLLQEMRHRRIHLAMVVDEYGGMAGIVTLEDLLEELVGDIASEHARAPDVLMRDGDGGAVVSGLAAIRDVSRELGIDIEEPEDATTMGGLAIDLAGGRIPRPGERFAAPDGSMLEIVDSSARRVRTLKVRPPPKDEAAPSSSGRGRGAS